MNKLHRQMSVPRDVLAGWMAGARSGQKNGRRPYLRPWVLNFLFLDVEFPFVEGTGVLGYGWFHR